VHPKTWTKIQEKGAIKMQKRYTIEEKKHAVQLVKDGLSRAEAARQTGICKDLIRDTMKLTDLHGWEILEQRRIYSAEEKFTILQDMQENQLTLAEASIKHGIKKSH
jgi:transposase-like protein